MAFGGALSLSDTVSRRRRPSRPQGPGEPRARGQRDELHQHRAQCSDDLSAFLSRWPRRRSSRTKSSLTRSSKRVRPLSPRNCVAWCVRTSRSTIRTPAGRDLRILVRERLKAGDGDDRILAYLVQRYGDFILLKPPLKIETIALWGAPFVILLTGGGIIFVARRRQAGLAPATSLSRREAERTKLGAMLGEEGF